MGGIVSGYSEGEYDGDALLFDEDEVVEFVSTEATSDQKYGHLNLKCKVLSGAHSTKDYDLQIRHDPNPGFVHDVELQFAKTFFSKEELIKGDPPLATRFKNKKFTAVALKPFEHDNGKTYQTLKDFKDLGAMPEADIPF
jgi:hypothetical protein